MKINEADGDKKCTCSCGSLFTECDREIEKEIEHDKERRYTWLDKNGHLMSRRLTGYECHLEDDVQKLQDALFAISSHYAKIQFRLSQIASSTGNERLCLLRELQRITCQGIDASRDNNELPTLMSDACSMGDVRVRQQKIITQLRSRLTDLSELADSTFCNESDSSYNLRKSDNADGSTLCGVSSDGRIHHGKYCACIVCREIREVSKVPASQLGYLSETWPHLADSEFERCGCRKKKKSKSKKQRNKRKGKKLDKIFSRRITCPNRYYNLSREAQSPSPSPKLPDIPSLGKKISSFASYRSEEKTPSPRSQKENSVSNSERKSCRRRTQSETAVKGLNKEKTPTPRKMMVSPNSSFGLRKSSRFSSKHSTSGNKRSQESFSSYPSLGKTLGPKAPQLSLTGRRNIHGGLPFAEMSENRASKRRESLMRLPSREDKKLSKTSSRSMHSKSSLSLQTENQVPRKSGSKRESILSRLSKRWSRRSSKKESIENRKRDPSRSYRGDSQIGKREQSHSRREGIEGWNDRSSKYSNRSNDHQTHDMDETTHSRTSNKRGTESLSRNYQDDIDEDQQSCNRKSSRNLYHHDDNEDDSQSLRSNKWKQPLGYSYATQNRSCKEDCRGNCKKTGHCSKIRQCFKDFENKQSKMYSMLGYSQLSQRMTPHGFNDIDQNQTEIDKKRWSQEELNKDKYEEDNRKSSRDSKRSYQEDVYSPQGEDTRSQKASRTEEQIFQPASQRSTKSSSPEYNIDDYLDSNKRISILSKKGEGSPRKRSQDRRERDSKRSSKNIFEDQTRSRRGSTASRRSQASIRMGPQGVYPQDRRDSRKSQRTREYIAEKSKRSSSADKRSQASIQLSLKDYGSKRSSRASKNILETELDRKKGKRSSSASRRSQGSILSISQEVYLQHRKGSKAKAHSTASKHVLQTASDNKYEDRKKKKSNRSSIASRGSQLSILSSSQEVYLQHRKGSKAKAHSTASKHVLQTALDKSEDRKQSKRSSVSSRRSQASIRSIAKEDYPQSRKESKRSSKASKTKDQEKSNRSSILSRKEQGSVLINYQDLYDPYRVGKADTGSAQSGWIQTIEIEEPADDSDEQTRSSKASRASDRSLKIPRNSVAVEHLAESTSYNRSGESQLSSDDSEYRKESTALSLTPYLTQSMVEITTNIERDNTNRTLKNKLRCFKGPCKGNCVKTVKIVECPFKKKVEQTENKATCCCAKSQRNNSSKPQQNICLCSKNRKCDSKSNCSRSQSGNYQMMRQFSYHSMLELPLVYPHAIGKPRKMKCELKICKKGKDRKLLEVLYKQKTSASKLKFSDSQTPTTSITRSNLTEDTTVYKDPVDDDVQTDC